MDASGHRMQMQRTKTAKIAPFLSGAIFAVVGFASALGAPGEKYIPGRIFYGPKVLGRQQPVRKHVSRTRKWGGQWQRSCCFGPRPPRGAASGAWRYPPALGFQPMPVWVETPVVMMPSRCQCYPVEDGSRPARFNPRSPRGERLHALRPDGHHPRFNPRSPRGERRQCSTASSSGIQFQPMLPAGGRRILMLYSLSV